jgi:hypothetical protein
MRKKTLITILLSAVIWISAAVLAVTSVYRVSAVSLDLAHISVEAIAEGEEIERLLGEAYKTESMFKVNAKKAHEIFADYPHLRVTSFERSYPNRLIIRGVEDPEVYAVQKQDGGYYILNEQGTVLCERATPANRTDGKNNVLMQGVSFTAGKGETPTDSDFALTIAFCKKLSAAFNGIRGNVLSVTLVRPTSTDDGMYLNLSMKEGVQVRVYTPSEYTEEKANSLSSFYLDMDTVSRMSGTIYVSGQGKCNYEP